MSEWRRTVKRAITFTSVSAGVLAIASIIVGYSESLVENALAGATVGALSGLLTCMAVCLLGNRLVPDTVRQSGTGRTACAIIGGYVGLIATSVLITITVTVLGTIDHLPDPFLRGALLSSLGGWVLGGVLGLLIGANWSRV